MKSRLITLFICCMVSFCFGQSAFIGQVLDESHNPIMGASITFRQLKATYISNESGKFSILLPAGRYQMLITHLNYYEYTNEITLPLKHDLLITLIAKKNQLEEVNVVNTGYQQLTKEKLTGSFTTVDNKAFNSQQGPGVLARLEGITSSLRVDRTTNSPGILIRGLSSLQGDRSPLVVLDNFPYEGNLDNLNPGDVESITVLKDAAATSIWGARAGNGVIVITTRKGKYNEHLNVNAQANHTLLAKPNLNYRKPMDSKDFIEVERMLFAHGFYNSQETSPDKPPLSPAVKLFIDQRDGKINSNALQTGLENLSVQNMVSNYINDFYSQAINRQYNFSLSKGSETSKWQAFAGYDDNVDALKATGKRINVKIENGLRIGKRFDLTMSVQFTHAQNHTGKTAFDNLIAGTGYLPPYTQFADAQGNALAVMRDYSASAISNINASLLDWNYYPLTDGDDSFSTTKLNDILGNLHLNYQLPAGFKLMAAYQYQNQQTNGRTTNNQMSYYTRNLINQFTEVNGTSVTLAIPLGAVIDRYIQGITVHQVRTQLDYDRRFSSISVNAIGGFELRQAQTAANQDRAYGVNERNMLSNGVNYSTFYQNLLTGSYITIPYLTDFTELNNHYVSFYGNASLGLKDCYYLTASLRRDASNLFGISTNNKWNPLWSVGAAWIMTGGNWTKPDWLDFAKLRVSYGQTGNANAKLSALTTVVANGISPYTQTSYSAFSNYANPDLRWERVATLNIGADWRMFTGKLNLSLDYYIKKSTDLISAEAIDYTTGVGSRITRNTAAISGRGLDVELKSENLPTGLKWQTSFYLNYYRDRVDQYYLSNNYAYNYVNGNNTISGIAGMPVYAIYAYRWGGLNPQNGNPVGYVNQRLSEDYATITGSAATINDLAYIGPAFPVFNMALGNTFSYHDFELDFRLTAKFDYYTRRPSLSYYNLYNSRLGDAEYSQRWQNPGDEVSTVVPSQVYPASSDRDAFYTNSEATIISGDHIRFQYIALGYSFKQRKQHWFPFKELNMRVIASNVGLLWRSNTYRIDPDYPAEPALKNYSLNLKLAF